MGSNCGSPLICRFFSPCYLLCYKICSWLNLWTWIWRANHGAGVSLGLGIYGGFWNQSPVSSLIPRDACRSEKITLCRENNSCPSFHGCSRGYLGQIKHLLLSARSVSLRQHLRTLPSTAHLLTHLSYPITSRLVFSPVTFPHRG